MTQCECLAAWDDTVPCICNKAVTVPIDVDKLKEAHELSEKLKDVDRWIAKVDSDGSEYVHCSADLPVYFPAGISCWYGGTNHRDHIQSGVGVYGVNKINADPVTFRIPRLMVRAALRDERAEIIAKLHATGVVSR